MPVSKREEALAAVAGLLATVQGASFFRTPNFDFAGAELPFVSLLDGEEQVEPMTSQWLLIRTQCSVVVGARSPSKAVPIGQTLNDWIARVRAVLGQDPTLGGKVQSVEYRGVEEPVYLLEDGAPPQGMCALNFEIVRQEAEFDPYSYMNGAGP